MSEEQQNKYNANIQRAVESILGWRKEQRRNARAEKSKLYWIFDSRIHETHRTMPRATEQEYQRMRIRYFFSWEGLSKFLLAPVFKIGLTSVIVTPFVARIYIALKETFGSFLGHIFPIHIGLLFFSGLLVVISRAIYELFCPRVVKAHINSSPLDSHNLQNDIWIQTELEHCLLQYIYSLPIDEEYVRGIVIKEMQKRWRKETDGMWSWCSPVFQLGDWRTGFDAYGLWLVESLLLRIAREKGRKLFVGRSECKELGFEFTSNSYATLYNVDFEVADEYQAEQKEISEGDFLFDYHETEPHPYSFSPKEAQIRRYFNGISYIIRLGATDIVKEFIAENENYWKPCARIAITIFLLLSMILLLIFMIIQTIHVFKAICF